MPTLLNANGRSGGIFDFENKQQRLEEVSQLLEDPNIWNDSERSQKLGKERRELESVVSTLVNIGAGVRDASELFEMAFKEVRRIAVYSECK